jgi:predicted dehydrogenase
MIINWGFIGAGMVAQKALTPAVVSAANAKLYAVAARDLARAKGLNPVVSYDNYDDLINDPKVDAIYISLPNHLHAELSLKSLAAGKAVLCEKPLTLNLTQGEQLFDAAAKSNQLLVEAIWFRWHPRMKKAQDAVLSGEIGQIKQITASFCFENKSFDNYRFDPSAGGGALYDLGVYPLHLLAHLIPTGKEIKLLKVIKNIGPTGVDLTTTVECLVNNEIKFEFTISFEAKAEQKIEIIGSKASITFDQGEAFTNWNAKSSLLIADEVFNFEPVDPYKLMVKAVSDGLLAKRLGRSIEQITQSSTYFTLPPAADSLFVLESLDAIRLWQS